MYCCILAVFFLFGGSSDQSSHRQFSFFQVFCQSAIDGAQNDHASKVHAILANKALASRGWFFFDGEAVEIGLNRPLLW